MKEFTTVSKDTALTAEQRNLLSVAYKNVVGSRRSSWRVLGSLDSKADGSHKELIGDYQKKVVQELKEICNEVLVSVSRF
jgi:hypothetical protein